MHNASAILPSIEALCCEREAQKNSLMKKVPSFISTLLESFQRNVDNCIFEIILKYWISMKLDDGIVLVKNREIPCNAKEMKVIRLLEGS